MKINANKGTFEPCPEYTGRGVCVDVTPLRTQESQYGPRQVFKIVFEVDLNKKDGTRFAVWSQSFTASLNEKANLRKFLRGWLGRDLTMAELADFETEALLGKPAQLVVTHQHKENEVYANIAACTPDKSGNPLAPSGKFVRAKDRPQNGGANGNGGAGGGGYRRAEQPAQPAQGSADHAAVKVHVGKHKGLELRELNLEAVQALADKWLPMAKEQPKQSADDKRLIAALEWWAESEGKEEDNVPY